MPIIVSDGKEENMFGQWMGDNKVVLNKENDENFTDKTDKYVNMIEAFECDFSLAKENNTHYQISKLQAIIENRDEGLMKDIDLLSELSFNLRHGRAKIMEVEND